MSKINIVVAGASGKMGSEALRMIDKDPDLHLVACVDLNHTGKKVSEIEDLPNLDAIFYQDINECLTNVDADILIDLTSPKVGYKHTKAALTHGVRPVVGTTGFTTEQIEELTELAKEKQIGGIIAPNFARGAVLMMEFSKLAAKFFPDVEIIEKHHDQKVDAPSGTAIKTAELIQENRSQKQQGHPDEEEIIDGARGADFDGLKIHSVRLPGLVAHQEVIFSGPGESLTIEHDSYHRESFMSGIRFAIAHVMDMTELIYGLEHLMID